MNILYVTSEAAPFVKTGGLGDVAGSLPLTLKEKGVLVRHFESERISEYVRITVGSLSEIKALLSAIKSILE